MYADVRTEETVLYIIIQLVYTATNIISLQEETVHSNLTYIRTAISTAQQDKDLHIYFTQARRYPIPEQSMSLSFQYSSERTISTETCLTEH